MRNDPPVQLLEGEEVSRKAEVTAPAVVRAPLVKKVTRSDINHRAKKTGPEPAA